MKLVIDIPEDIYTRLFDNGEDIAKADISEIAKAIRKGETFKMGHWIKNERSFYTCDKCGFANHYNLKKYNYCPNCGAKMR